MADDANDADGTPSQDGDGLGLAKSRSRREKKDKTGRKAMLERLRDAKKKGERVKMEISDEAAVYEEVDEKEYSKIVQNRLEDDWIVDDDGSGYYEDGREVFEDEVSLDHEARGGKKAPKRAKNPNIRAPGTKAKNLKSMFAAQMTRGPAQADSKRSVDLKDDDLLGDIMAELQTDKPKAMMPPPLKLRKKTPKSNPFSSKAPAVKKMAPTRTLLPPTIPDIKAEPQIDDFDSQEFAAKPSQDIQEMASQDLFATEDDFNDDMAVDDDETKENKENKLPSVSLLSESQGWIVSETDDVAMADVHVDSSRLPLVQGDEEGQQVMRMFWLDIYEDSYKQPDSYVSCCVRVQNIERRIFLLPREKKFVNGCETNEAVTFVDVYKEFNDSIAPKHKISKFKSRKVEKEYCFELPGIPDMSEYMEVRYSAEHPALPSDLTGETFSQVFGSNTTSQEIFILDRKLKGPCWINIADPTLPSPAVSWCKVEAVTSKPASVCVSTKQDPPPPLVVMSLNLRTVANHKSHHNEIIGVTCLTNSKFHIDKPVPKQKWMQHFCAFTKPSDCVFPFDFKERAQKMRSQMKVEIQQSERALLAILLARINKTDPDVIVGHDVLGYDLDVLLSRLSANKIPHWSRLGRLKRSIMPKINVGFGGKGSFGGSACCGRLVCDVKMSAKELIRARSYDLTQLTADILKERRQEVEQEIISSLYSKSDHLFQFIELTLMDSAYIVRIMFDLMVLPLALQITNICGNVMSRTLMGGRAERNEYLLLHAFTEKNFIVPDKQSKKKKQEVVEEDEDGEVVVTKKTGGGRRKPAYSGGLVLEPKKGFYDKYILLLDFNSLYPSIIQEYNICFTTINYDKSKTGTQAEEEDEEQLIDLPDGSLDPGVLPTEIRKLVQSRRQVKQLMKQSDIHPDLYMQYDIRQKALKLTANSMYGCLGFSFSRFYAKPLAALVTGKGREMTLDVIYGDTDSIMVNTNSTDFDQVFKLGNKIKTEVNKLYKLLEIDIDGVFKSMLLLKKKKYAALTISKVGDKLVENQELKGLDIVRRDWCELAKNAGNYVVSEILSGKPTETILENIHGKLEQVGSDIRACKIAMDQFQITKQLTKNPEDYPDKKSLPHVQVAMRLNSNPAAGRRLRAGDVVYYVVCDDGSTLAASQRAYHTDELAKNDKLKIDVKYYLSNQVHPVVARLCEPIDGTDAAKIANALGLDPTGYRHTVRREDEEEDDALLAAQTEEERYRNCERFSINCPFCKKTLVVDSVFVGKGSKTDVALAVCAGCNSDLTARTGLLKNLLTIKIRGYIKRYYESWLKCTEPSCGNRTRRLPLEIVRGYPVCQACRNIHRNVRNPLREEFSDSDLYDQLSFFRFVFDLEKGMTMLPPEDKDAGRAKLNQSVRHCYTSLSAHVGKYMKKSSYGDVNLSKIFGGLGLVK